MSRDNKSGEKDNFQYTGLCIVAGTGIGIIISLIFTKNIVGMCFGTAVGLVLGIIIDSCNNRNKY